MTTSGKIYKIRHKEMGKFKCAGYDDKWSKNGKVWGSMAALKGHLHRVGPKPDTGNWGTYYMNHPMWEIIEYDITGKSEPKVITLG